MNRRRSLTLVTCSVALALVMSVGTTITAPGSSATGTTAPVARADTAPPGASRAASSAHRRAVTQDQLRTALRAIVKAGGIGVVGAVSDDDGTVRAAAGRARIGERASRATPDARFRAASITKMFTSVLALQMVDQGRWSLSTTIGDVAPRLWPRKKNVTLGQLLSHRSGLDDYLTAIVAANADTTRGFQRIISRRWTPQALLRQAKSLRAVARPGKKFFYSNTNFLVVGVLLERANHDSLGDLMRQRILRPAGMSSTSYSSSRKMKSPSLHEYARYPGGRIIDLGRFNPVLFSGAGALTSTTTDLQRFQYALSTGALLGPATLALMRSRVSRVKAAGYDYGYGSYRIPDPCVDGAYVYGHDGASFGTHSITLSSGDGRRRVTLATTGRAYTKQDKPFAAMLRALGPLLETTCGAQSGPGAPTQQG